MRAKLIFSAIAIVFALGACKSETTVVTPAPDDGVKVEAGTGY